MSSVFGAIINYVWSSDGIHYFRVFSSHELYKDKNLSEVEINCLSISPLHFSNDGDNDDEAKELVTFD